MRLASVLLTSSFLCAAAFAADPFVGTWKVNIEKSKTSSGRPPQTTTQKFEATSDGYQITSSLLPNPITLRLDGKDYTANIQGVAASVGADKSSARRIDSQTIESTFKRNGKIVATINRKASADGRFMTTTSNGVSKNGEKFESVVVYEKQ